METDGDLLMAQATLVVAIDYGSKEDGSGLSPAGRECLIDACKYLNGRLDEGDVLAYCLADIPALGMVPMEALEWKMNLRGTYLFREVTDVMVPGTTSISEARNICKQLEVGAIVPRRIIIFCDTWHALRLRLIWPHLFPHALIEYKTKRYVQGSDFALMLLRFQITWIFANIAYAILMWATSLIIGEGLMLKLFAGLRQR